MARIAKVGKSEVYAAHVQAAQSKGERGDCAVRAVAALTDTSYEVVHAIMAEKGRKHGRGTPWSTIWATFEELGFKAVKRHVFEFIERYPGTHATALKSVTTHHPDRFPNVWKDGKSYLFCTREHVLAVINGVNHDWTRGKAKRAKYIYEIVSL